MLSLDKMDEISEEFEIDVILDEYQMFQLFNINKYLFEIDIIRKISKVQSILYHIECFL